MKNKETVTKDNIEQDIIGCLKKPPEMSKAQYIKLTVPSVIIACIALIITCFHPAFFLWALLALFVCVVAESVLVRCIRIFRITKVSVDDYEVGTGTVSDVTAESYVVKKAKYHVERINNYSVRFTDGRTWRIPKDNYLWSVERPMSDFAVYQSTHRDDVFITVVRKGSGEIVMAYNTGFFTYKD